MASKLEGISPLTYNKVPPPLLSRSNRYSVLNPSLTKLPTKKLLWIFVLETIKTFILLFTWTERNSKLFLMDLRLYERKQAYLNYRCIKFSKDSFACVILDKWDLHSLRHQQENHFLVNWKHKGRFPACWFFSLCWFLRMCGFFSLSAYEFPSQCGLLDKKIFVLQRSR